MNEALAAPEIHSEPDPPDLPPAQADVPPKRADCPGWLVNLGWLHTTLALSIAALPVKYLLKDGLHLNAEELSRFLLFANLPIYVKPFAGLLCDAVPLFGTRRRHYVLLGLPASALFWVLLGLVPRTFGSLLWTYLGLNIFLTVVSTALGGLMVEVGKRENRTGRLGAQRHGITLLMGIGGVSLGGYLVKWPFLLAVSLAGFMYASAVPAFWVALREPGNQRADAGLLRGLATQVRTILRAHTLWSAAGMIVLVVAAPGFGTPLFFHQTGVLKFTPWFVGFLAGWGSAFGVAASWLYTRFCRRFRLRAILTASIVLHAVMTLFYLLYRSKMSALWITGLEGATAALAILPLYDLAARATPRGSEALGFCVILSVWNLTAMLSDFAGSWLYTHWHLGFGRLVWLNAGTTALVLLAVPFLPRALSDRREGDEAAAAASP